MKTNQLLNLPRPKREKIVDVCTYIDNDLALRPDSRAIVDPDHDLVRGAATRARLKDAYAELVSTPAKVDPRCLVRPLAPPGRRVNP